MTLTIEAEGLTKRFGEVEALAGIDLAARRGSVLGLLGPNGAGKTTAVRVLATLLRPDAGRVAVGGLDVVRHPAKVRRLIGLTGQFASIDEDLTGWENLVLIGELLDLRRSEARRRAEELLRDFGLAEAGRRQAKTYSGGMHRRLDLAASLVGRPEIVFLDEPTTGLDPAKREDVWNIVKVLVADGTTVLLTTQYLEEADALADDISVVDHGRVIAHGTPDELKRVAGRQTIMVRPADPALLPEAAAVIAEATGRTPENLAAGVLTVPVEGDAAFHRVVGLLAAERIAVTELSLRLPSLDEVFFTLTGHRTDEETSA